MAQDLVVGSRKVVELDDPAHPSVAGAFERFRTDTLADLVRFGVVRSDKELERLLNAAKQATAEALADPVTMGPSG